AHISDSNQATIDVVLNTFMEIGLEKVAGRKRAFINLTRPFLLGVHPLPFDGSNVTLEVLEDIEIDDELITAVYALANQGYQIALDDFIYSEPWVPLLKIADIVKLDIQAQSVNELKESIAKLRQYKVKLLAEKVESRDEFEFCLEQGFDMFQGFFFCKPLVVGGQRAQPSPLKLSVMNLLQKINHQDFNFDELVDVISLDTTLVYKLLRYINSAYYSLPTKIGSVRHALVILGEKNIRLWVNLIVLTNLQDKTHELLNITLIRAKMCELIAVKLGLPHDKDKFFLVGLFSTIDVFLNMSMQEIVATIPLADDVKSALLSNAGILGEVLSIAQNIEKGHWEEVELMTIAISDITESYLESLDWAYQITMTMKEVNR
ncbi:MAG: HDOD domain-containing protein, partial [Gammaproteobacteria bacterium]|nr:HDOD domain-containing protein [Gammaproteobacteria bacterium]